MPALQPGIGEGLTVTVAVVMMVIMKIAGSLDFGSLQVMIALKNRQT